MHISHVDWNDESVPVGKRKVAFVWWLTAVKGLRLKQAQGMANSKFGPSEASARSARNRQDDKWRKYEQRGIRRWGHPGGGA